MCSQIVILREYPYLKVIQEVARKKGVKIFLVGGFIRDYLLGQRRLDFDFAVSSDAIKIARQFARKIRGAFVLLDEEHGCARVAKKKEGIIQTYDFADFRAPTLFKDLAHRDFTINTLCVDIAQLGSSRRFHDILIDRTDGLRDLNAKRIRMTMPSVFQEDPLRLMRAFSLQSTLEFRIEKNTLSQIKKDKKFLSNVSYERIRDELFKILLTPKAAENLISMDKAGLLERAIPQIRVMQDVKQGGYHHLDVWPHSLETVVQLEKLFNELQKKIDLKDYLNETLAGDRKRYALMKLVALFHDIGKPDTRKREKGKLSFHGHERVGRDIVRTIAQMLKLATRERNVLEDMVFWHLRPGYLSNFKKPTERAVYRYFRDTKEEGISILLLSLADQQATRGSLTTAYAQKHHKNIILNLIQYYLDKKRERPFVRLINGHDLIRKLRLRPSPLFSKILSNIEEQQAIGKIKSKKEAFDLAKKIARVEE